MEGTKVLGDRKDITSHELAFSGDSETHEKDLHHGQKIDCPETPTEAEGARRDRDTINFTLPVETVVKSLYESHTPSVMELSEDKEGLSAEFIDKNTSRPKPEIDGTDEEDAKNNRQSKVKSQSCSMCGKMFYRVGDRKRHEVSCLRSPFRCRHCIMCFSSENDWYDHEKRHTEGPIYKCAVCGKTTINQRTWRQHMRLKHPAELKTMEKTAAIAKCQHCDETFNSYLSLGDHMKSNHPETLAKVLSHHCPFCERSYSSRIGVISHQIAAHPVEKAKSENSSVVKKRRKKFQCDQCGKVMRNGKYHSRIHSGERPYPCKICKKSFASHPNLKQHMRTHSGEKPYKCRYCTGSFTTSGSRIRHERIHTGDKPFQCQFCGKAFKSRAQVSVHERSHTGETPYQCPQCDKKFCYKNTFDRHVKAHKKQT